MIRPGAGGMIRIVPLLFVLLWSSSFVTAKLGLRYLSPLLFVAVRLVGCALVLALVMLVLRRSWRPLAGGRWLHCAVAGALLNAIGLMGPHVALMTTPAAQIALMQSLDPAADGRRRRRAAARTAARGAMAWPRARARWRRRRGWRGGAGKRGAAAGPRAGAGRRARPCRRHAVFRPLLPRRAAVAGRHRAIHLGCRVRLPRRRIAGKRRGWNGRMPRSGAVAWNTVMVSLGGMVLYSVMLVARLGRERQREFLSGAGHGGAPGLGVSR